SRYDNIVGRAFYNSGADFNHVTHNSASCGQRSRTFTIEHQLTYRIAFDEDGVELIVDAGQRMGYGNQRGSYTVCEIAVFPLCRADELNLVPRFCRPLDIVLGDLGDSFRRYGFGRHADTEDQ